MNLLQNKDLFDLAYGTGGEPYISYSALDFAFEVEGPHICTAFPVLIHQGSDEFAFTGEEFYLDCTGIFEVGDYIQSLLYRIRHNLKLVANYLLDTRPSAAKVFRDPWNFIKNPKPLYMNFIYYLFYLHYLLHNPSATRTIVDQGVTFR